MTYGRRSSYSSTPRAPFSTMTAKYAGECADCGKAVRRGDTMVWESAMRRVRCQSCGNIAINNHRADFGAVSWGHATPNTHTVRDGDNFCSKCGTPTYAPSFARACDNGRSQQLADQSWERAQGIA